MKDVRLECLHYKHLGVERSFPLIGFSVAQFVVLSYMKVLKNLCFSVRGRPYRVHFRDPLPYTEKYQAYIIVRKYSVKLLESLITIFNLPL